jgi:eukaryotic-like serine/threonine-protein kinase
MHEVPRTIGPYRILQVLGRGGMGVVYRGVHGETGEAAAIKTVTVANEALLGSIRREIRALSRIRHPGVVRVLAEGLQESVPWYAMELLDGKTLGAVAVEQGWVPAPAPAGGPFGRTRTLAEARPAPREAPGALGDATRPDTRAALLAAAAPAEAAGTRGPAAVNRARRSPPRDGLLGALTLVRRLCAPLAYLHGEGIVHRDLKPDNILLRAASSEQRAASSERAGQVEQMPASRLPPPASRLTPVLVDFGIVRQLGPHASREALEVSGMLTGTVAYMAPEQVEGRLVDARADLYALGCILYELVTGQVPFTGTAHEVLRQHVEVRPLPPSERAEDVPPELDALVLRLLEKAPKRRIGHADDVAALLAGLGADEDGPAGPGVPQPRAYLYRPGFAGRRDVLDELVELSRALSAGTGGLCLVGGESGVGRTRLLLELLREAKMAGVDVLVGECRAGGERGAPLQALRRPLRAIARRSLEGSPDEALRILGAGTAVLEPYEPELAKVPGAEARQPVPELPAEASRQRVLHSLLEVLRATAMGGPLMIVLDDLQWADELTLQFLDYFVRRQDEPSGGAGQKTPAVLIAGAYRTEEAGERLQALARAPDVRHVELEPLDEQAVGEMVGEMLALDPPPQHLVRFLAPTSQGNPFFVAEYLRTALDEGILRRDGLGRWHVVDVSGAGAGEAMYERLSLPGSLRELVVRRLDGLSAAAMAALQAASVLGRQLETGLLAAIAGLDEAELLEALEELLLRQMLDERAPGRLQLVHELVRDLAYARIDPRRRSQLHREAAEALTGRLLSGGRDVQAELGYHWEHAGRPGSARACYLDAARRAADRYAHEQAEAMYRACLRLTPEPGAESLSVRS